MGVAWCKACPPKSSRRPSRRSAPPAAPARTPPALVIVHWDSVGQQSPNSGIASAKRARPVAWLLPHLYRCALISSSDAPGRSRSSRMPSDSTSMLRACSARMEEPGRHAARHLIGGGGRHGHGCGTAALAHVLKAA